MSLINNIPVAFKACALALTISACGNPTKPNNPYEGVVISTASSASNIVDGQNFKLLFSNFSDDGKYELTYEVGEYGTIVSFTGEYIKMGKTNIVINDDTNNPRFISIVKGAIDNLNDLFSDFPEISFTQGGNNSDYTIVVNFAEQDGFIARGDKVNFPGKFIDVDSENANDEDLIDAIGNRIMDGFGYGPVTLKNGPPFAKTSFTYRPGPFTDLDYDIVNTVVTFGKNK